MRRAMAKKQKLELIDFIPSWTATWTVAKAKKELSKFKFKGPGWYIGKVGEDALLVYPLGSFENPWKQKGWAKDQLFRFCVYSGWNPCESFNLVINAPERV